MKRICIFSSASNEIDEKYYTSSEKIVMKFIENKYDLVYGGSSLGLMGYTAELFHSHNRKITSIIPEKIFRAVGNPDFVEDSFVVNSMHERKLKMREISDCFMALPGGFGTFEELLEVITLKQLGYIDLPVIIANIGGYYDDLIIAFERMFTEKFAKPEFRDLYIVSENPETILRYVTNYTAFERPEKF